MMVGLNARTSNVKLPFGNGGARRLKDGALLAALIADKLASDLRKGVRGAQQVGPELALDILEEHLEGLPLEEARGLSAWEAKALMKRHGLQSVGALVARAKIDNAQAEETASDDGDGNRD